MNRLRSILKLTALAAALGCGVLALQGPAAVIAQPPAGGGEPEVLTRGPIHEAFAEPIVFNPKPGLVIEREPPAVIEELPPDEKPEGENVGWLGGYWSFDDERKDFIWTSGFWRVLPPNRQWVAGYWTRIDAGFQWTCGYWAPVAAREAEYLPAPPDTLEAGASTESPSADHIYIPGTWSWYETRYAWRPGYYIVSNPGWMWCPAHYVWSPCGYVFVDGYWDLSVRRRGVIFAPCYISPVVYARVGYVYSPTICIDADIITDHFFCRPSYCHYYFGDYYAPSWGVSFGITPWFTFHYTRGCYCPCYSYYSCHYARIDPGWSVRIRADFSFRVSNVSARPPVTYIAQQNIIKNTTINNITVNKNVMAKPLKDVAKGGKDAPMKFEHIDKQKQQTFVKEAHEVRKATDQRVKLEKETANKLATSGGGGAGKGPIAPTKPVKVDLPSSPHLTKAAKINPNNAPPAPPKQETTARNKQPGGGTGSGTAGTGGGTGKPNDPKIGSGSGQPGTGSGKPNDPKIGSGSGKPNDPKIGSGSGQPGTGSGKPNDPKIGSGSGKPNDPKPGAGSGQPGTGSGKPMDPKSGSGTGNPGGNKPGAGTGNPGGGAGNPGGNKPGTGNPGGKPGGGAGNPGGGKPKDPDKPNRP